MAGGGVRREEAPPGEVGLWTNWQQVIGGIGGDGGDIGGGRWTRAMADLGSPEP